jgi:hypothetical protein
MMGEQYDDEFSGYVDAEARRELARQEAIAAAKFQEGMGIPGPAPAPYGPTRVIAEDPNLQPGPAGGYPGFMQPPVRGEGALPVDRLMRGTSFQDAVTTSPVSPIRGDVNSDPDPTSTSAVPVKPKLASSWTDAQGNVYTRKQGWKEGISGTDIVKKTEYAEGTPGYDKYGDVLLQGRGIPVLQDAQAAKIAEKESKRRAGMTKQELYDEYIDKSKQKILTQTGIDIDKDYVAEAEAKVKAKWKNADRAAGTGNFLYEDHYNAYMKELTDAKAIATQKMARGQTLLAQAIKGVQGDVAIPKEGTVVSSQGGPTLRGNENVKQGEIGYIFDVNKTTGKTQIIPLQGWSPAKGAATGTTADGTGAGSSAVQKAIMDHEVNGIYAKAYNLISPIIQEYAAQYDPKIAAAKKIRESTGSSEIDRQKAASEEARANVAKRIMTEIGSGSDISKVLEVMKDPNVAQLFMDPGTARLMDDAIAGIHAKHNPNRQPGAALPSYIAGGQPTGNPKPAGQPQIFIGMTQPYVYKGQKVTRQFTGKGPDGKWQWQIVR